MRRHLLTLSVVASMSFATPAAAQEALRVFFAAHEPSSSDDAVYSSALDGSDLSPILASRSGVGIGINSLAETVYLMDLDADAIVVCAITGAPCNPIATPMGTAGSIRLDLAGQRMYWTDFLDASIWRANLDGSDPQRHIIGQNVAFGLALDVEHGKLYWTASSPNAVRRANLDGTNVEDVLTFNVDNPRGLAVDPAGSLYVTEETLDTIIRCDLDGSNPTTIIDAVPGMDAPYAMDIDVHNGLLYWAARQGIWRARTDGTDITQVHFVSRTPGDGGNFVGIALQHRIATDGEACSADDECLSRSCADGVCCADACDGFCRSCASADTGMPDGECHRAMAGVGTDALCDDFNECTDDFCGAGATCDHVANESPCDDGDACTAGDMCGAMLCQPGPRVCDAGPPDAGPRDAGASDAGAGADAGPRTDAGAPSTDAGTMAADAGAPDGGPSAAAGGCMSSVGSRRALGWAPWGLALLLALRLRRRR